MNEKSKALRSKIRIAVLVFGILASLGSAWKFGELGAVVTAISVLCLALGFWLTEGLVGVMTGVKKANTTAIGLLLVGKLGWWLSIFALSRLYPPGSEIPIAVGMGAFLLALLVAGISQFGWPKISDANGPGEP